MLNRLFLKHPRSVGESYGQHLWVCWGFAFRLIGGGLACLVHGVVPALFETTGSRTVTTLHQTMVTERVRRGDRS